MPEKYDIAEDETSPEVHDIAKGVEEAAKLMLALCQQNEMEKHGKSREIKRQIETETSRAIWYTVEEICRGWRIPPTPEAVGTSVNGILGRGRPPDHSRRGWRPFSDCSRKMFGYGSGEMGTNFRSTSGVYVGKNCLCRRGRPIHHVRHVSDETEFTILFPTLDASPLGHEITRWTQEWPVVVVPSSMHEVSTSTRMMSTSMRAPKTS